MPHRCDGLRGAMRNQRAVLIVVLVAVVGGGGFWWWKSRGGDPPPAPSATRPVGSGGAQTANAPGPRGKPAPATVSIAVTDERGPIGNAMIRLAPSDGEVLVVRTGPDGNARADQ